ncbi:MAG: ABC transporter ATP-binding protein [Rhizobiales bacterium 65-9]|nr:ABC transporter ATP-binding protein [Hyphomicrobiales bacterium]OJY33879.1 MAG: ABC transporter ATP-binding protein [Rhizobiales bacterium 65-9]
MLSVDKLCVGYGEADVLHDVTLRVGEGEIVAVLGANGAGKTTLLAALSGLIPARAGEAMFDGRSLVGAAAERIVGWGLSHVPQGRRIFPGLSVMENLVVARTAATDRAEGGFAAAVAEAEELFPRLNERRDQLGWSLSGGEQQMLAVARALVARPKMILLDEPSLGLAPMIVETMFSTILEIRRREKVGMLVVEQNAEQALRVADRVYVMELGRIVLEGPADEVARDPAIERAYLGA